LENPPCNDFALSVYRNSADCQAFFHEKLYFSPVQGIPQPSKADFPGIPAPETRMGFVFRRFL
jgi:hypothetical protein